MSKRAYGSMVPFRAGQGLRSLSRRAGIIRGIKVFAPALLASIPLVACGSRSGGEPGLPDDPTGIDVTEASIADLQTALAAGRVTSVDLVDAYLTRIAAYDDAGPELNAIIAINPDARAAARALDQERASRGPRGPLHGIPIILKDNFDFAGMPTTGGSVALVDHLPSADAHQVRLLREAGAVILAKANLHELAYGITTISAVGGQTRNPYDTERNPGGSSGGTAAAIAASFAAIGWGSDTCGSIRIPAAANNLFGLRPTKGISSVAGILPLSHSQDVAGPLARTMADLVIGLRVTVGADSADPATTILATRQPPAFPADHDPLTVRGSRIGIFTPYLGTDPEDFETTQRIRFTTNILSGHGADVVEVDWPEFDELIGGTSLIDFEFKWDLMDYLGRTPDAPVKSLTEIVEGELYHEAVGAILRRSDRHATREPEGILETRARRAALGEALLAFMDELRLDVLAYPSLRRVPALIGQPAIGNNCQLSAATGFPALTVPAGFTDDGVPVGLELLARPFADDLLVSLGFALESATRPRRTPPTTPPLGPVP
jgi:amidase